MCFFMCRVSSLSISPPRFSSLRLAAGLTDDCRIKRPTGLPTCLCGFTGVGCVCGCVACVGVGCVCVGVGCACVGGLCVCGWVSCVWVVIVTILTVIIIKAIIIIIIIIFINYDSFDFFRFNRFFKFECPVPLPAKIRGWLRGAIPDAQWHVPLCTRNGSSLPPTDFCGQGRLTSKFEKSIKSDKSNKS